MKKGTKKVETVDDYIATFPKDVQQKLKKIRAAIKKAAPQAKEKISYHMAGYSLDGVLVYFAGYKKHIGFYPMPSAIKAFNKELAGFELSKGTVRFPLNEPLPLKLISKIVKFRAKENMKAHL